MQTFLIAILLVLAADDRQGELFTKRIQPVLKRHCYECHSDKADELKGNLRLDTRDGILKGGDNGPLFQPGDVENSFLLKVIRYQADDYQMPPRGKLPDEVIQDFEKWIKAGGTMPNAN